MSLLDDTTLATEYKDYKIYRDNRQERYFFMKEGIVRYSKKIENLKVYIDIVTGSEQSATPAEIECNRVEFIENFKDYNIYRNNYTGKYFIQAVKIVDTWRAETHESSDLGDMQFYIDTLERQNSVKEISDLINWVTDKLDLIKNKYRL